MGSIPARNLHTFHIPHSDALLKAHNYVNRVPVIAPPSDINAPPPEPYIKDDDSVSQAFQFAKIVHMSHSRYPILPSYAQTWAQESDEVARCSVEEDGFVAASKGTRFGLKGTRNAYVSLLHIVWPFPFFCSLGLCDGSRRRRLDMCCVQMVACRSGSMGLSQRGVLKNC